MRDRFGITSFFFEEHGEVILRIDKAGRGLYYFFEFVDSVRIFVQPYKTEGEIVMGRLRCGVETDGRAKGSGGFRKVSQLLLSNPDPDKWL
jgi:hypothetical protein